MGYLTPKDGGLVLALPRATPTHETAFVWIGNDLGEAAVALLRNYQSRPDDVLGKTYSVANEKMTPPQLAETLTKCQLFPFRRGR